MAINNVSLYGTTPAPFLLTGTDQWGAGSIRFTQKGEYLYAIDLEKPTLPYIILGVLAHEDSEIRMLSNEKSLKWEQIFNDDDTDDIIIEEIPNELPCAWSFKIQVVDKTWGNI